MGWLPCPSEKHAFAAKTHKTNNKFCTLFRIVDQWHQAADGQLLTFMCNHTGGNPKEPMISSTRKPKRTKTAPKCHKSNHKNIWFLHWKTRTSSNNEWFFGAHCGSVDGALCSMFCKGSQCITWQRDALRGWLPTPGCPRFGAIEGCSSPASSLKTIHCS